MMEKMATKKANKGLVSVKEELPDDEGNMGGLGNSAASSTSGPRRAERPTIRVVTKMEESQSQGSNLAASEDTWQAAAEEDEIDDPTMPNMADSVHSQPGSPRDEDPYHWSRSHRKQTKTRSLTNL